MRQTPKPFTLRPWVLVSIGLGANLGDAQSTLEQTLNTFEQWATHKRTDAFRAFRASSLYASVALDTPPGQPASPDYVNAVAQWETRLNAYELLAELQNLENLAGRVRPYRNAPRSLDLDLLLFGAAHLQSALLTVPHPRMHERAFVLQPLAELMPQAVSAEDLQRVSAQGIQRLDVKKPTSRGF